MDTDTEQHRAALETAAGGHLFSELFGKMENLKKEMPKLAKKQAACCRRCRKELAAIQKMIIPLRKELLEISKSKKKKKQ